MDFDGQRLVLTFFFSAFLILFMIEEVIGLAIHNLIATV